MIASTSARALSIPRVILLAPMQREDSKVLCACGDARQSSCSQLVCVCFCVALSLCVCVCE
jgi:hypothetical protein